MAKNLPTTTVINSNATVKSPVIKNKKLSIFLEKSELVPNGPFYCLFNLNSHANAFCFIVDAA